MTGSSVKSEEIRTVQEKKKKACIHQQKKNKDDKEVFLNLLMWMEIVLDRLNILSYPFLIRKRFLHKISNMGVQRELNCEYF